MFGLCVYLIVLIAAAYQLPEHWWDAASPEYLFILGGIGLWRYGWGVTNLVRALLYIHIVFPRMRRQVEALGEAAMPRHSFLLVTSFRIDTETTRRVYASVFEEAKRSKLRCTVIASIVEMGDQRLIKALYDMHGACELVDLEFIRIAGTGKRDALGEGFRVIARRGAGDTDVACVIDGDSILEPNILRKSLPFIAAFPDVGAFTTDEVCEVVGPKVYHHWYSMRFAQRQILMSSHGLAKRVLTLTGRMSAFRANILTRPDFIKQVEVDWVDHWRLGRFKFLTGDDKSSWYYLIRNGWKMLYIPDVRVITIETVPDNNFFKGSTALMVRWFGNMLRTNSRALALGPRKISLWSWWSIFDQRISMWTSLTGLVATILVAVFVDPLLLVGYLFWVALTRFLMTVSLLASRENVSWTWPFLLFYNQIYGSMIKTYIFFRLDRQKWTRQSISTAKASTTWKEKLDRFASVMLHACAIFVFVAALGSYMRVLTPKAMENLDLMMVDIRN